MLGVEFYNSDGKNLNTSYVKVQCRITFTPTFNILI